MTIVRPKLDKLVSLLQSKNLDAAIIGYEGNIRYYAGTGVSGATLLVSKDGYAKLLVPLLEYHKTLSELTLKEVEVAAYYRYPVPGVEVAGAVRRPLKDALKEELERLRPAKIGVDKGYLTMQLYEAVSAAVKGYEVADLTRDVSRMRSVKESDELRAIERALAAAEKALSETLRSIREGVTEAELAGLAELEMRRLGCEGPAFPTIVAVGSNAAYPHATPSGNRVKRGDAVLIDLGCRLAGYCSDLTRTLVYLEREGTPARALEAVYEALMAGVETIAPGVSCSDPDTAARRVLEKEGLSRYFVHSLGHGIGIDVHEEPRLSQEPGEGCTLEPGMVVTVEPGVYVPGLFGVRIEDMVVVTKKSKRVLTRIERLLPP